MPETDEYIDDRGFHERIRRSNSDRVKRKDVRHRERGDAMVKIDHDALITARVIGTEGAYFICRTESSDELRARTVKSTVSENHNATLVSIGDSVGIELGMSGAESVIKYVRARRTKLARKLHKRSDNFEQVIAANVDVLCITMSCLEPPFRPGICDRYIIAGLDGGLEIFVIVNKIDLLDEDPKRDFVIEALEHYSLLGYTPFLTSTENEYGIDILHTALIGKTSVFAGKSGVGKSSIVNALVGENVAKTNELARKQRRGVHTTTNTSMLRLAEEDSYIIDTPGVREFFNYDLDEDNLKFHYPEFEKFAPDCDMTNCTHIHEPGCAVFAATERGDVPEWRYNSYAALYEEAVAERKKTEGRM